MTYHDFYYKIIIKNKNLTVKKRYDIIEKEARESRLIG